MGTENGNGQTMALARAGDVAPSGGAMTRKGDVDKLAFEPANLDAAIKVAGMLLKSGVLPAAVKSPEAALAIIMRGREYGLTAMQSLTSIYIVDGKTSMSADLMVAKVLESGLAEYFEFTESTPERCTYVTKRKGRPEKSLTWTLDMAQKAGVASKDVWRKYPAAMLRHRTSSDLARAVYPEVVLGLYDPDELAVTEAPPTPSPEAARAQEVALHADLTSIRAEVEKAARALPPAMFERYTGAPLAVLMSGPVSALRAAHEKLKSAVAEPEPKAAPVVIDVVPEKAAPVEAKPEPKPETKPVETPAMSERERVGGMTGREAQEAAAAKREPAPEQAESAKVVALKATVAEVFDEETGEVTEQDGEPEVTVSMLSAANAAARKKGFDQAVAVWKQHCAGRSPKDLSNAERVALLRELESIGGGS